ncbi:hypothetical protein CK203_021952 [Vitis vinifera]|uniref:Uncharacterized protein n=1 Tax=Vitis vinifera TaxID=29760 RepID=A0A438JFC2_VITVI|nr:hypothetical protein CK203_021952 [Vitis vinifera]
MATTGTTEPAPVNGAAQSPGSDPKTELSETPLSASNAAAAESEQAPSENLESESTAAPETEAPAPASEKKCRDGLETAYSGLSSLCSRSAALLAAKAS